MKLFQKIPIWVYLLTLVSIALWQVYLVRDVVMGDAFIHFVFARGIAEGQPFFYNGEFSAGSTSPLWSSLLAPLWKISEMNIVWTVKVCAGFFVGLAVLLSFALANKISRNTKAALTVSALTATSFVLPYWAAKGMETPLFVCLVLGAFLIYTKILETKKSLPWEILLGIVLGIAILTRPEAWFLSAFLGIGLLCQKKWKAILSVGLPALIIISPYYYWLYENTGQIFPSSLARILRARQWAHDWNGIYFTLELIKISLTKLLPLTPFFLFFFWDKAKGDRFVFYPIYAWLGFHLIFFSFVFPTTEGYRYILAALPFFYLIAVFGIFQLPKKIQSTALIFALAGSMLISGQQLYERIESVEQCEQPFIDTTRRETGLWIRDNTDEDDLIAMKEIDQSAFYGERQMLSIDGTLDTEAIPFVESQDQLGFIQAKKPDYLIIEEEMYREYPDWRASNILPVIEDNPELGMSQTLSNVEFTLRAKKKSGDEKVCGHFSDERFWYIFELTHR